MAKVRTAKKKKEKKNIPMGIAHVKSTFNNTFNALMLLQEQAQRMMDMYLEQASGMPEEGKKAILEWNKAYRKSSEEFKKAVDESFGRIEELFAEPVKAKK